MLMIKQVKSNYFQDDCQTLDEIIEYHPTISVRNRGSESSMFEAKCLMKFYGVVMLDTKIELVVKNSP